MSFIASTARSVGSSCSSCLERAVCRICNIAPCFRVLFKVVRMLIFLSVWAFLGSSLYYFFYTYMIPPMLLKRDIYIDYENRETLPGGTLRQTPKAVVDLTGLNFQISKELESMFPNQPPPLARRETYDIRLMARIPRTDRVRDLGAVMVRLELKTCEGKTTVHSARPIVLPHSSPLVRWVREVFWLFFLVFGWRQNEYRLDFAVLDRFREPWDSSLRSCRAELSLSTHELIFSEASLEFTVTLTGPRYIMFHYWPFATLAGVVVGMSVVLPFYLYTIYICTCKSPEDMSQELLLDDPMDIITAPRPDFRGPGAASKDPPSTGPREEVDILSLLETPSRTPVSDSRRTSSSGDRGLGIFATPISADGAEEPMDVGSSPPSSQKQERKSPTPDLLRSPDRSEEKDDVVRCEDLEQQDDSGSPRSTPQATLRRRKPEEDVVDPKPPNKQDSGKKDK